MDDLWATTQARASRRLPAVLTPANLLAGAPGKQRQQWAPELMARQVAKYLADPSLSMYSLAKHPVPSQPDLQLPLSTFRTYCRQGRTTPARLGAPPLLPAKAETAIVAWLGSRELQGAAVTKDLANQKISEVLQRKVDNGEARRPFATPDGAPSKSWHRRFSRKHPQVRLRIPSRHSSATLRASRDPELFRSFFYDTCKGLRGFSASRTFVMDEQALATRKSRCKVYTVLGNGTRQCRAMEIEGLRAHTSLVNCMAKDPAIGALPTGLIMGGRQGPLEVEGLNKQCFSLGYTRGSPRRASSSSDLLALCICPCPVGPSLWLPEQQESAAVARLVPRSHCAHCGGPGGADRRPALDALRHGRAGVLRQQPHPPVCPASQPHEQAVGR